MQIKYSIIIPHKNIPNLLQRCLNSIPARQDLEVIVIDDNSDATKVDFTNFPQKDGIQQRNIFDKHGGGAGYARNQGIKLAQGEWVFFADADDIYITENLNRLLDCNIERYDVVVYPTRITQLDGTTGIYSLKWSETLPRFNEKLQGKNSVLDCYISDILYRQTEVWVKMIKLKYIKENNIQFENVPIFNDVLFSMRLAACTPDNKIGIYTDMVYHYTRRQKSISDTSYNPQLRSRLLEMFKAQRLLISVGKQQYLDNISWYFEELNKESFFSAMKFILIQMRMVSIWGGVKSMRNFISLKQIRIGLALGRRFHNITRFIHTIF